MNLTILSMICLKIINSRKEKYRYLVVYTVAYIRVAMAVFVDKKLGSANVTIVYTHP